MAGGDALITRGEAMQIAEEVVSNPGAPIEPRDRSGDGAAGAAGAAGGQRARRAGPAQAGALDHHLRRPADAVARRARGPGPGLGGAAARALRGRAGRRVPGHRPDPVGDPAARVRLRRDDAGADRGPETGDLRLPRRRRLLLPVGGRDRGRARHAGGQLPLRPGADRRLRRDVRRRQARARGDRLPARPRGAGAPGVAVVGGAGRRAAAGARGRPVRSGDRDDPQGFVGLNSARSFVARDLAADLVSVLSLGRADRRRAAAARARGRAGAHEPARGHGPRRAGRRRRARRSSTARAASSPRPRRASGCGCWRRWSGRRRRCAPARRR